MLFSLEYMGKFIRLDIEPCDTGIEFNFGQVYANSESVDSISQLYAAFTASIVLDHSDIDLDECKGGFFSLSLTASDNSPITVSKLVLTYDSTVQQTAYSKLKADTLASLEGYIMDWKYYLSESFTTSNDFMSMAEEKMAEESSIESDIIAGIDLSSVSVSGDTTYFTSVMSNGEKIRFEATGASVKENGVTLSPGGSVTSLDSVGKIYLYTIGIDNAESYPGDCFFDCGYGYTYSSSKTIVNSASEVHTEPSFGCMISELTVENRIPIAAVQPNFIYFSIPKSASQDVTIGSLIIGYNPNEKTTGIVDAKLNSDFFTPYLIGELYNTTLEDSVKAGENNLSFYLILQPDTEYSTMENSARSIFFVPHKFIEIGDLKNANGESVEFTIGASALTGDVIVIPAAGTDYDGPFGEYIMIDLFSDKGLNKYDCANFGLSGVSGIRISHVNANMEKRTIEAAANAYTDDIIAYTIGTIHYANDFSEKGFYNIEVIQAGKKNTFTKPDSENTLLSAKDLFKAGDVFTLSDYSEFFYNGLLDNGSAFGYTVTVVSVGTDSSGNPTATVRITAD